jgi:hypothetical protein
MKGAYFFQLCKSLYELISLFKSHLRLTYHKHTVMVENDDVGEWVLIVGAQRCLIRVDLLVLHHNCRPVSKLLSHSVAEPHHSMLQFCCQVTVVSILAVVFDGSISIYAIGYAYAMLRI